MEDQQNNNNISNNENIIVQQQQQQPQREIQQQQSIPQQPQMQLQQQGSQNVQIKSKPVEKWVVQEIVRSNNMHPTKDWNEQFQQDLHRSLLNFEETDTKRLGQVVGVAVLGLIGLAAVSVPIVGLIAGSVIGVVLGGYAGKRIKRKKKLNKNLIHFDLFMINCACYIAVIVDEIQRNKGSIKLNNFRFKIQKTFKEYKGVEVYYRLSKSRQKGFKSEMVRLVKALQNPEAFKAMYLIYKMTKLLVKDTEENRTQQQLYDIQYILVNVMKPAISVMNICIDELNFDLKYILLKYEKFVLSYEILQIIENLHPDLQFNQEEFLQKLEKDVTYDIREAFTGFDLDKLIYENELQKQQNQQLDPKDQKNQQSNIIDLIQMQMKMADEMSSKKQHHNNNEGGIKEKAMEKLDIRNNPSNNSCSSYDSDEIPHGDLQEIDKSRLGQNTNSFNNNKNQQNNNNNNNNIINQDSIEITFHQNGYEDIPNRNSGQFQRQNSSLGKKLNLEQINKKECPKLETLDECISTLSRQNQGMNNSSNSNAQQNQQQSQNSIQQNIQQQQKQQQQQIADNIEVFQQNQKENNSQNAIIIQQEQQHQQSKQSGREFIKSNTVYERNVQARFSYVDKNNNKQIIQQESQQVIDIDQSKRISNNSNNNNHCKDDTEIPDRIEIHSKKQEVKKIDQEIQNKLDSLMKVYNETYQEGKWNKVINKSEITIYKKMNLETAAVMVRAEAKIKNTTCNQVFSQIYYSELRSKWDKVLLGFSQLEKIDETSDIIYSYVDPGFGVSKRDWVQKRYYQKDFPEKGQITICYFSTDHPQHPPKKNHIRADSVISGYIITQEQNDVNLFMLSCNDIKGLLPKYVVNFVAARAPKDWINSLQKSIDKLNKK